MVEALSWERQVQEIPYGNALSQMSRTLGAANRYLSELLAESGIEGLVPYHGDILLQLFAHEALPMATLAAAIGRDPSTVTALIKKLISAGYVETAKSAVDKRVTEVRLTEQGRALGARIAAINQQLLHVMAQGVSKEELSAMVKTLATVRANFEKASGK